MRKVLIVPAVAMMLLASSLLWAAGICHATSLPRPTTITFAANNPGSSSCGNSTAAVTFTITGATNNDLWTLKVGTTATTFTGCCDGSNYCGHCYLQCIHWQPGAGGCRGLVQRVRSVIYTLPTTCQVGSERQGAGHGNEELHGSYHLSIGGLMEIHCEYLSADDDIHGISLSRVGRMWRGDCYGNAIYEEKMKKPFFLTALGVLFAAFPAHAQLGLGMAPMRVELKMAPGQQYSGVLKLSSESGLKTRIRAEVLDFDVDDRATPQFERDLPREAAFSCKKWLSLNPMEIEIDKGGFLNVRYTLTLPADLPEGSYNCAAGFTTLPPSSETTGMGMQMAVRIVGAFYVVVGNPPVTGRLSEMKLDRVPATKDSPEGSWEAIVMMENTGHMYYRPTGKLEVLSADGKVAESLDFPSLPVLRERNQRFVFPLKTQLDSGNYRLRARVDIGTGEIQEGIVDVAAEQAGGSTVAQAQKVTK